MVPVASDRVSRARPYSGTQQGRPYAFAYRAFTFCGASFHPLRLTHDFVTSRPTGRQIKLGPTTPARQQLPPITSRRFRLFPFRSPLLRESRFLSFPRATKMFQFTRLPHPSYVFRRAYARITTRGFPHSEIPGSKVGQHLPRAYRSRPRPSSAPGAKASTVCPYSLDRKEHVLMSLWSFQGARGPEPTVREHRNADRRSGPGLSKLNSVPTRSTLF